MNNSLQIVNLHAKTDNKKKILKGISVTIPHGEIHVLMGKNGSGKTTLANAIMGNPAVKITGKIILNGKEITNDSPDTRAKKGLFLGFQEPVAVPGVQIEKFLTMAMTEQNNNLGNQAQTVISSFERKRRIQFLAKKIFSDEMIGKRMINDGFSGGEKKKLEILQLMALRPLFAILDEPDSGLDTDALHFLNKILKQLEGNPGILIITHYHKMITLLKPDKVHVMNNGKIVQSGDYSLAEHIEKYGYKNITK